MIENFPTRGETKNGEIRRFGEQRDRVDGLPFPQKSAWPRPQNSTSNYDENTKRGLEPMLLPIGQTARSNAMMQSAVSLSSSGSLDYRFQ